MFSFHIAFTTFKKQGFTSAEKLVFQIFFLMNIFKGQKENKRPIKCPLMDNKGHFHFELSFKGHVNKKSTASTPAYLQGVPVGSKSEAWFYLGAAWSPKIGDQREGPGGQEFEIHAT